MSKKNKKRQIAKISVFITSIFVILFSVTYAFLSSTVTGEKQVVVNAGVLDLVLEEENEITISDALPMYDEVGMIQEDVFVFRLVNKTANDTNYILKLQEIETGTLDKSIVKYGLIKEGEKTIDFVSNIIDGVIDEGTIKGNDTIDYELRLWIDSEVTSLTQVQSKFLSFRMSVNTSQEIEKVTHPITTKLFSDDSLGDNCKTYDDGTDTFLVGQCSNNYVWYSGKLWRVVLKNNETGVVKMVTDNAVTTIPYNESRNTTFENSYVDQWLRQEFLPTLHDYEDYLVVDSVWDATANSSYTPTRPTYRTKVTRTLGLLNRYEYDITYSKSDSLATSATVYLQNGVYWWLMTPASETQIWRVYMSSTSNDSSYVYGYGIRPTINMQPTIQILSGTGIQSDPYILEDDLQKLFNGITLLSTRYSGEYITFNNELYRIVDKEIINGEILTKITAVNKPSTLVQNKFHNVNKVTNFANVQIKTDLENYYQGLATTNNDAFNMIVPNTTWYLGTVGYHANYKASICAEVDADISMDDCEEKATSTTATIGLPRLGEMFTSHITRVTFPSFWTLTPVSESYVRGLRSGIADGSFEVSSPYGARPSMYLKSNVVIASDNTGNGTYEKPYSIELGQ